MTILLRPSLDLLPGYVAALERGWSPDSLRAAATAKEPAAIASDPAGFVASLDDLQAPGAPIRLPDSSLVPRLPGFCRWIWDAGFAVRSACAGGRARRSFHPRLGACRLRRRVVAAVPAGDATSRHTTGGFTAPRPLPDVIFRRTQLARGDMASRNATCVLWPVAPVDDRPPKDWRPFATLLFLFGTFFSRRRLPLKEKETACEPRF